ncbi:immunoglobulin-binding protein 1 [Orussus abietinus]|uniref:immunoglobulin-binding protein 1 n=1 Tax=Orussus abietinus TaxID=222816 RepID=UPI000625A091|nr:immunoglobulin-binding protein 1 [Orussus abietinus]
MSAEKVETSMSISERKSVNESKDASSLSELFDSAFALFNEINKTNEATNSPKVQSDVKRAMNMFEDVTKLVSIVDMFSGNETFDEVSTENVKYFLLPAFLGTLTLKICAIEDRMHIVRVAEIYFLDFLKRLKTYGVIDINIPETSKDNYDDEDICAGTKSNAEMIVQMVSTRNAKLEHYREKKELEDRLNVLEKNFSNLNIDDEAKREYFVTLLKVYVNQAIDEIASIAAEKPLLEHMKRVGHASSMASQNSSKVKSSVAPLKPIIITRDVVQKKVYGAGYPSLPVMTVQEFYDKRVQEGDWPDPSQRNQFNGRSLQDQGNSSTDSRSQDDIENEETERKIESDDPELLERKRAMDEYKDTHRRGWGNRANRS